MIRFLPSRRAKRSGFSTPEKDPQLLVTEYVLNMSISCLGDIDVTPLYEEYIRDSRLGTQEKAELTAAYRSLHPMQSAAIPT